MRKIIAPILFCLTPLAHAQSFDALVDSVIMNNPALKSADAQIASEIYDAKGENMLSAPEAEFEYLWGRHDAGDKLNAGITQEFDWPGAYAARRKAIKSKSRALQFLSESNKLEKRLEIKLLYIDIINNKKNKKILQERIDVMNQLIEKYARGVSLGQLSRIDLNKLKIENIRLKNSMTNLESQFQVLKSSLEKLNGGKDCQNLIDMLNEYPDEMILPVDEYYRLLNDVDPSSKYSESVAESQMQSIKAEKMARMPGFSLGYHYSMEGGETFNGLSVGIKLPAFSSGTKIKAAEALSESLLYDKEMLSAEKRADMLANRNNAVELLKKYSEYKSVMKNDDSIDQLKKSLDAGEISIIDYLAEMDFFIVAAQEMLQLEYDYMVAVTNLNKYKLLR
ncbi:MAG: TolC family protein [Bacteroides sp.]|nr:TolC family protein [Lachnospiraceae bacterium]MCM1331401.1 TolC family protein [Bacteroides sp.]MCM1389454.1 TolC family protein [Bacteroides sp.]